MRRRTIRAAWSVLLAVAVVAGAAAQQRPGVHPISGRRIAPVMGYQGAEWLERIEEENARELTPERLAKLEAESARADADAMDEVLKPRLDESDSPTAGRRFTRA